jgi:hypothetical protein
MSFDLAAYVAESRAKQGLEPKVTDEAALLQAAGKLLATNGSADKRKAAPLT